MNKYLPTKKNTLLLTLHKKAFEVMITGEKTTEYRKFSDWIKSRLFNKDGTKKVFQYIKFVNGYGKQHPYFICLFRGFEIEQIGWVHSIPYSNGLTVGHIKKGDFLIFLGRIIEKGNLKNITP